MSEMRLTFHLVRPKRAIRTDAMILLASVLGIMALLWAALTPADAREYVAFNDYPAGTLVVRTTERHLFFSLGEGLAIRYPVAVGKAGKRWHGLAHITGKYVRPSWAPPEEVRRDHPELGFIAGGAPENPMGERAMTLDRAEIAIHGTNRPKSIGTFASYGCIRMHNADIIDLFDRVDIGAPVLVLP